MRRERAYTSMPSALIPEDVARRHGWDVEPTRVLVGYGGRATPDQVDSALTAADRFGAYAYVEEGPDEDAVRVVLLIVAGVAAFVTLVGVAISVALSAAEGRADLATLAAVGAPPRRRRALAAAQALLVAGLGCALGVAFGTFVALRSADDDRLARLRDPVAQPRDHGDRGAAARRAGRGAVHAEPTAARAPRYVGGSVPSTRRRPASLTSTFQIGASALTRSISARAPANASPRCGAEAATITDGSDSAHGAGAVLDRHRAQAVALGLLGGDRLELGDRHLGVRLVVELGHLARDALEDHHAAGAGIAHGVRRARRRRAARRSRGRGCPPRR